MAVPPSETESSEKITFLSLSHYYSHYLRNRIHALYPFFSNFASRFRSTHRRECFPLPLPSFSLDSSTLVTKGSRVHFVLEDIIGRALVNLHSIQKNLQFWQCRAKRSDSTKARFMIFERGPRAFIDETVKLLRGRTAQGSSVKNLCQSASDYIDERVAVLSSLRYSLATFLAQVYTEVDKIGEELVANPESKLPSLLATINDLFSTLEASIGHLHTMRQSDSSVDGSYSVPLLFEKMPEINEEGSQWTDCEMRDAINSVYQNLDKLDSYISFLVIKHRKPRKITQYWIRYACGAVGLSVCSIWLLRHSSLMGSSDLDNWIQEAKNSTIGFFENHVEQPILSIRDELFDTFRKRHQGIMDHEEVKLTADSLHRMLLAFSEQAKGQKFPVNASDQEMLEIVMYRYEKELMHPIQNILNGELVRAILIQVQKLKLDTETAMLELDQILRANEINFAVLTALPAFFLSLLLIMLVRAWFKQDTKAEGRGRVARIQRRLLVVEVKKRIMRYQIYVDQGLERDAKYMFGLVLYSLDRLYHSVKWHAEASGEWECLRQDIIDLANPGLQTANKLSVISHMVAFDCLLPSQNRR
ncbi:protein DGS1, mitochondrial [Cajanus cajan]|uniref:protein DGS1, mitochondrial n=1 Tax=Cajanus cajan TaxID=3821 RepID=UPI00098D8F71|nr:protein DGS1, mitochondrial [Cajanus cajan]